MKKIKLTQGKYALVDDSDYEWLSQWKWCYSQGRKNQDGYAVRKIWIKETQKTKTIRMHRLILNLSRGELIDHINGDTLDNRRINLRKCNYLQNGHNRKMSRRNTSGYKGIYPHKSKWRAYIGFNKKLIFLGDYKNIEDAIKVRNLAEERYFGEFRHG